VTAIVQRVFIVLSDFDGRFSPSSIQCLVFDAVGTLIQPNPPVPVAYHSIASRYGSQISVDEIGRRFRRAFRQSETDRFPNGPATGSNYVSSDSIEKARWRWIVEEVVPDVNNLQQCFAELWDHFARPASWTVFDDVGLTLTELSKAGYRLVIASNFDSRLHSVCRGHDVLSLIERSFVSSEMGYRKPAKEFYSTLISRCGCLPNEILMIGDDPEHDVAGPIAANMHAMLIDRKSSNFDSNSIRSLDRLLSSSALHTVS
jgi:putative hydrolase of the HAD superfamily